MKRTLRITSVLLLSTVGLVPMLFDGATAARGGSNQQCSQRGGSRNVVTIVCVAPTVALGDVKVNIKSLELLSDTDLNLVVQNIQNNVDVAGITDVNVLADNTFNLLTVTLERNVTQVCVTALSKNACRA